MRPISKTIVGITYGEAKTGKTLAAVRAFPDALFVAPPGALLCANWLDWTPNVLDVTGRQGFKFLTETVKKASGKFPAIVIDDFSLIADMELELCKAQASNFAAFDLFNQRTYQLIRAAREAKSHVFFTCHVQAPREVKKDNNNRYIPGAPLIPGWQMPAKFPAMVDFCARVIHDTSSPGWPYKYATGPDEHYVQGDRLAVLPATFPLNLREAMLGAGIDVPRPEALAWMDEHVEGISKLLSAASEAQRPDYKKVMAHAASSFLADHSPRHARWVLADAMDRMVLRQHTDNLIADFIGNY
jgi:hypothetical protein